MIPEPLMADLADGPVVAVRTGGDAKTTAAALGRLLALRPAGVPEDPVLEPLRRMLLSAEQERERRLAAGESVGGNAGDTDEFAMSDDLLVSTTDAAVRFGVEAQSVRKRCRLGQIPGAVKIAGVWAIPRHVLPREEPDDHQDP